MIFTEQERAQLTTMRSVVAKSPNAQAELDAGRALADHLRRELDDLDDAVIGRVLLKYFTYEAQLVQQGRERAHTPAHVLATLGLAVTTACLDLTELEFKEGPS